MEKITFGIIVTTRGFFNPELGKVARVDLLNKLEDMGYNTVCLSPEDTKFGLVETMEDAHKCSDLFKKHKSKINGIIVCLPNFGDEVGVVNAIHLSELNVPILVQACDDEIDRMDLEGRRDAFCGKLSVCNNLYQFDIKFTDTTYHTCAIDSDVFTKDIEGFAKICRVLSGLKGLRVAQFGTRPAAFQTVRYSEKLLQRSGITVIPVDMSEIIFTAKEMPVDARVKEVIEKMKSYGTMESDILEENILKQAKLYVTIKDWMIKNDCQTGTIQCWDSIQKNYGCATCLTMSMLGEEGIPMACETDVLGAITMYALYLANLSPAGYLDWNNSYGEDRDKCIGIHCSNYPKSFIDAGFTIGSLDVLGKSLGKEHCSGALKATVAKGKMTYAKISTDDFRGKIKVYVGEGEFTDDKVNTLGGVAVCKVDNLQGLMKYVCANGFEHHVAMNRGNSADVLEEAFGKYLEWKVYNHNK